MATIIIAIEAEVQYGDRWTMKQRYNEQTDSLSMGRQNGEEYPATKVHEKYSIRVLPTLTSSMKVKDGPLRKPVVVRAPTLIPDFAGDTTCHRSMCNATED